MLDERSLGKKLRYGFRRTICKTCEVAMNGNLSLVYSLWSRRSSLRAVTNAAGRPALHHLCLAAAMILVGSSVVVTDAVTESLSAAAIGTGRFAFAVLGYLVFCGPGRVFRAARALSLSVAGQSLVGTVAFTWLLAVATSTIGPVPTGIILGLTPVIAPLLASMVLDEPLQLKTIFGGCLAAIAVVILHEPGRAHGVATESSIVGTLAAVGAALCEALFIVLGKSAVRSVSPLDTSIQSSIISLFAFGAVSLPFLEPTSSLPLLSPRVVLALAYYGLGVTVGGFLLWNVGSTAVRAGEAAVYSALLPISAGLLSYLFLGAPFSSSAILALLISLVAIGISRMPMTEPGGPATSTEGRQESLKDHRRYCGRENG